MKELSNAFFGVAVAFLVLELCASLSKNIERGKILPLMTGDLMKNDDDDDDTLMISGD